MTQLIDNMEETLEELTACGTPPNRCTLYFYDNCILFYPIFPFLEKEFTITVVDNDIVRWQRQQVRREECMYIKIPRLIGEVGCTFGGFDEKIVACLLKHGVRPVIKDMRRGNMNLRLDLMHGFRFSQERLIRRALAKNKSGLIGAPTRYGKCHPAGNKVLMHDYTVRNVEDVRVGDYLMGPDGVGRKVIAIGTGSEPSYKIIPNKGEEFSCNESHILSLQATGGANLGGYKKGDIINIQLKDYLTRSKTFKHVTKLWYAPLEFPHKNLPYDPWIVGVWLGDGSSNGAARITKPDTAVQQGIIAWAETQGLLWSLKKVNTEGDTVTVRTKEGIRTSINPLTQIARMCQKSKEVRCIPTEYLTASRQQRMELLAGLIDTDGNINNKTGYEITTKYKSLSDGITQLCRGLGFRVTRKYVQKSIKDTGFKGWYWRMQISGPTHTVPCRGHKKIGKTIGRVDPKTTGFTVEAIGTVPYYGFELEGPDHLYLMWDHCVTHNTTLIINVLRAAEGKKCIVVLPGVDLCRQMYDACKALLPGREVALICTGSRYRFQNRDITVCSVDSLEKTSEGTPSIDFGGTDIVLFDEPHAMVTVKRVLSINKFRHARRIGFGATLEGRSDKRDAYIIGLIGPVLASVTYKEAVAEGAICPINVIFLKIKISGRHTEHASREGAYDDIFFLSSAMAELTRRICEEVIPLDWQTLLFIKHEKQAELYLETIGTEHTIAMAKRMTNVQRKDITERCATGEITRCLCSNIFVQGVTFSHSRVLVNLAAGGNNTTAIQKPGRLAEIRPGKRCGIMIDFLFVEDDNAMDDDENTSWKSLCGESRSRLSAYKKIGYGIRIADSFDELKEIFNSIK